jgi:hypothetical protein
MSNKLRGTIPKYHMKSYSRPSITSDIFHLYRWWVSDKWWSHNFQENLTAIRRFSATSSGILCHRNPVSYHRNPVPFSVITGDVHNGKAQRVSLLYVPLLCSGNFPKNTKCFGTWTLVMLTKIKYIYYTLTISRDSAVGIATGWGLDDRGVGVRVPIGDRFFPFYVVQTGSWAQTASYPIGTAGVKRSWNETDHLPPTNAEVKKTWIYTSTSPYISMG